MGARLSQFTLNGVVQGSQTPRIIDETESRGGRSAYQDGKWVRSGTNRGTVESP